MQVPFLDFRVHHEPLMGEFVDAFRQVTESSAFAGGPFVARFETEFAGFCRTELCAGGRQWHGCSLVESVALGVGPGDEVITAPNSFMATAEAISLCGARPVFVDVDERLTPSILRNSKPRSRLRTQAIIPVHLFGQMADDGSDSCHRATPRNSSSGRRLPGAWRRI